MPKRPRLATIGLPQFSQVSSSSSVGRLGRLEFLRVVAVRIAAAGEEDAELAGLLDHLARAALVARLAGRLPFLEAGHLLRRRASSPSRTSCRRSTASPRSRRLPFSISSSWSSIRAVYSTSRMSSNTGCSSLSTSRRPRIVGRNRPSSLVHVVARLEHADDRRVGARPADAVLFERLDERPFVEPGRRLRELLFGPDLANARAPARR